MHWIHSRKKFLSDILKVQDLAIEEQILEKQQLQAQLDTMKRPFGFIAAFYNQEKILEIGKEENKEKKLEMLKVAKEEQIMVFAGERQIEEKLDIIT